MGTSTTTSSSSSSYSADLLSPPSGATLCEEGDEGRCIVSRYCTSSSSASPRMRRSFSEARFKMSLALSPASPVFQFAAEGSAIGPWCQPKLSPWHCLHPFLWTHKASLHLPQKVPLGHPYHGELSRASMLSPSSWCWALTGEGAVVHVF